MKIILLFLLTSQIFALPAQDYDEKISKRWMGGGGQPSADRTITLNVESMDDLMKLLTGLGSLTGGNPLAALEGLGGNALGGLGGGNPLGAGLGGGNPLGGLGGLGGGNPLAGLGGLGGGNPLGGLGGLGGGNGGFSPNNLANNLGNLGNNALDLFGGNTGGGGGGSSGGEFHKAALDDTNMYRQKHGVQPLQMDEQLNRDCEAYAQQLARMNKMEHSKAQGYGENLFMMGGAIIDPVEVAHKAVKAWYDEVNKYNWNNPQFTSGTGHFTALVWKDTKKMGIGMAVNQQTKSTYVVARYVPPGNWRGAFAENVLPPRGR